MRKVMKKLLVLTLVLTMVMSNSMTAFATENTGEDQEAVTCTGLEDCAAAEHDAECLAVIAAEEDAQDETGEEVQETADETVREEVQEEVDEKEEEVINEEEDKELDVTEEIPSSTPTTDGQYGVAAANEEGGEEAGDTNNVAKIGENTYTTFEAALTAANAMTGDVTVEILGAVEFANGMELKGSYSSITFISANNAKMTINQSAGGDYLEAHGKTVNFNGLTLDKANPAWAGNSGHMGNYFSVQGGEVTYEECTFLNGACTSTGTAIYNNCTFQNDSEYGLWVYDDAIVTVNGGTISSKKGIKVYSEDETTVTSTLVVENVTFTENVTAKPAVAIGYAESVTLIGNTYNNTTEVLELDSGSDADCEGITFVAQDAEGKDIASTLTAVDRSNSNAACGVLVDGKIYTTVTEAAKDAEANDTVTLLYNSTETVELPNGVTLNKNGYEAEGVTVSTPEVVVAQIGETTYTSLQEALDAAAAGSGDVTVEILDDIDLSPVDWNPVTVSAPGYPKVIVNGNNKTITGLNDMLFAGTWAGGSGLIINDLTIKESTIENDVEDTEQTVGVGAFIGYPQASAVITLNNCHLVDSTVTGGHWTGGLIGAAAGYSGTDGPVFMNLEITGCSVKNSMITGKGSVGAIIGHAAQSPWTQVTISDTEITGNTITSTGTSDNKAGSVMGTIGAAGQPTTTNGETLTGGVSVEATVSDNAVTSNGTEITTIYGRQGSETGVLTLTGGTYDSEPVEENASYIVVEPDAKIVCEDKIKYYGTVADALTAAKDSETIELIWTEGDEPVAMNGSVYGKTVTITGIATVDWSKGNLFVGRGGEGDGKVIFDGANLTSASNNASNGIHVSGREKDTDNKYDGTLEIRKSTIELDYLINKGTMTLDKSTLTVKNGFSIGGRPAAETESGEDATATITLDNDSKLVVNNHNGMGLGYEAIGVMDINGGSTFKCTQSFLVTGKGTLNVNDGKVEVNETLTNNGKVKIGTEADKIETAKIDGAGTLAIDDRNLSEGIYEKVIGDASRFAGTLEIVNNDAYKAEIVETRIFISKNNNATGGGNTGNSGSSTSSDSLDKDSAEKDDSKEPTEVHYASGTTTQTTSAKTGDASNAMLWIGIMGVALIVVVAAFSLKKKSEK